MLSEWKRKGVMRSIFLSILLFFCFIFSATECNSEQYTDKNGVTHIIINSSGENKNQSKVDISPPNSKTIEIPLWEKELNYICEQAKEELKHRYDTKTSDYSANSLLAKGKDLRSVIENMNINDSLKYTNLRILTLCEEQIESALASRKYQREFDRTQQSLKDKLKNIK